MPTIIGWGVILVSTITGGGWGVILVSTITGGGWGVILVSTITGWRGGGTLCSLPMSNEDANVPGLYLVNTR